MEPALKEGELCALAVFLEAVLPTQFIWSSAWEIFLFSPMSQFIQLFMNKIYLFTVISYFGFTWLYILYAWLFSILGHKPILLYLFATGNSFSQLPWPSDTYPFFLFFEHFLTLWHYKRL